MLKKYQFLIDRIYRINSCHIFISFLGCSTTSKGHTSTSAPWPVYGRLITHYDSLVHSGSLRKDPQQRAALLQLEELTRVLTDYTNIPIILPQPKDCLQNQPTSKLQDKVGSRETVNICSPDENVSNVKDIPQEVPFVCAKLSSVFSECLQ